MPWPPLFTPFNGYNRSLSRALQSRGFIEEVQGTYQVPTAFQGGGIDQYGEVSGFMNFEFGGRRAWARSTCSTASTTAPRRSTPRATMGDCEMWELLTPLLYLGRGVKASTGGAGPPPRRLGLRDAVHDLEHPGLRRCSSSARRRSSSRPGIFGGYPAATSYVHSLKGTDLIERAQARRDLPAMDGSYDEPALFELGGERDLQAGRAAHAR